MNTAQKQTATWLTLIVGVLTLAGSFLVPEVRQFFGIERKQGDKNPPEETRPAAKTAFAPADASSPEPIAHSFSFEQTYRVVNWPRDSSVPVYSDADEEIGRIPRDARGIKLTKLDHHHSERIGNASHIRWKTITGWLPEQYLGND